jgi:dipeptidyl-peptidase-4
LQRHGIQVNELREDIELDVEIYRVTKLERGQRPFQGHRMMRVECTPRSEAQIVRAGAFVVRADQPLGTLAGLLLEPQSEDGLATWNFFDDSLKEDGDFPVLRLTKDVPLLVGGVRPLPEERRSNLPIDLRMTLGGQRGPDFNGSPTTSMTWLDDGEHYLQNKRGTWYKVHARTGRLSEFIDPAQIEKSIQAIEGLSEEAVKSMTRRQSYSLNSTRTAVTLAHGGASYLAYLDGSPGKKLPKVTGQQEFATPSPDGKFVAFVRGGNLWVMDATTGVEQQLTTDGGGAILNGKADWVYEEEIFDRRGRAFWWSPDSKNIAFIRFDDTPVKNFAIVNHIPTRSNVEQIPYPKAGDPNPLVKLGVASVNGGDPRFFDIPDTKPDDMLISAVEWWPDGKSVYCYVQNRVQSWLDVVVAPLTGETPRKLFRETTGAWVDNAGPLYFLPDGSFLFLSDRSGFRHLYRYRPDGTLLGPVTQGDWEVKRFIGVDPDGQWVYFAGTKDNPRGSNTYRASVAGNQVELITRDPGHHAGNVSLKSGLTIDSYSSLDQPIKVVLRSPQGRVMRVLDSNPVYQREEYRFGKVQPVIVPTPDGHELHGTLIYPPDFAENKKYPVWIKTYAGPHAPQVNDSWAGGRINDHALASCGIVIFYVDPRSASGLGAKYTWTAYKQLGVQELKDLETAVDWLTAKPYVDAKRIGLSGHSYGGFMTAYALTHSKKFAAGISGAPVTDWRLYDSIYTERYMLTPKENPQGYDVTSCVKAARNLHGKLLLLHGLMDDNVHVQNSVQLIHQLQLADKDFEVMVYPTARHGIGGRHYQRQIVNFICKTMGVPMPALPRDTESQ